MEEKYSTVQEISQHLNLKCSTLYLLAEENRIPHYRIGRLIRFRKSEIDHWMEGHREDCIDISKKARRVLKAARGPVRDIDRAVKKAIAEAKGVVYTASHGKPDQVKGLGKEVQDGSV